MQYGEANVMLSKKNRFVSAWGLIFGALLALSGCSGQTDGKPSQAAGRVVELKVTARQFAYEPAQITVRRGDTLRLTLTSSDVTHGFAIREYNVIQQVLPGRNVTVEFRADQAGQFQIFCTVFCGAGHGAHKGLLTVEEAP